MLTITNIDFKQKKIQSVECSGNFKDIQMSLIKNTFCVKVIYNEGETITQEVKKPNKEDTIEEVNMNLFDKETENTQQEQMNISCKIEEQQEEVKEPEPEPEPEPEEVKEEEPEQQEQPKEEQQEEPKEEQQEEVEEPKEEQQEEVEEPKVKKLTIEELKEILIEKIEKKNTALTYYRTIKHAYEHFASNEVYGLLQEGEEEIIYFIEDTYKKNISTISTKLCGILKCYTVLNLESKLLKDKIQHYKVLLKVKQEADKEKVMDKKSVEEGQEILNHCKNEMNKLGEKVKNDIQLLNTWDITVQMYCVLKIYLDIGNLRGDEIVDMKILDTDTDEKINYINTTTKKITIKNHKTESSTGTRIIDIEDKKLMGILRKGLGKYLITDTNGELFKTSSKFGEYFKSLIGYNPYDLRKALTSKCIRECITEGNTVALERLSSTQGHSLATMLNNYNTYNQENIILDTCLID